MKKLLLIFGALLFFGAAKAQPYIGLHFIGSSPFNQFCDSTYRQGFGFNMEFFSNNLTRNAINPNAFDVRWGLGADFQGAGREKQNVTLNTPNSDPGEQKLSNSHLALTGTLRFTFLGQQKLSPYVDGFGAIRGFQTFETLTMDHPSPDYESTTSNKKLGGATFHYGASVGAMYKLNRIVSLDFRVTYSVGSPTDWVNLNSVVKENNNMTYRHTYSNTDLFMYRVGFVFRIDPKKREESNNPEQEEEYEEEETETPNVTPKKKPKAPNVTPSEPNKPSPKKPLEVKPAPPAPKPKPQH